MCAWCREIAHHIDDRVKVGPDKLKEVASFYNLDDKLSPVRVCEQADTTYVKTAWKKFRELLPVLTSHQLSYKTRVQLLSGKPHAPCQ